MNSTANPLLPRAWHTYCSQPFTRQAHGVWGAHGVIWGAMAGLLAGAMGVFWLPVIGPVIAVGHLDGTLTTGVVGSAVGGTGLLVRLPFHSSRWHCIATASQGSLGRSASQDRAGSLSGHPADTGSARGRPIPGTAGSGAERRAMN